MSGEAEVAIKHYESAGDAYPGEVDRALCSMCRTTVGWVSGDAEILSRFYPVFTVQIIGPGLGDSAATDFCEDCYGWLQDVAPAIARDR